MTVIDEDRLQNLLSDLARAIEVPADGPERVLAARGPIPRAVARPPGSPGRPRRWQLVAVGVALATVGVVALGISTRSSPVSTTSGESTASPSAGGSAVKSAGPLSNSPSVAGPLPAPAAPTVTTKIIKTGNVDLQVGRGKLSPTVDELTALAGGLGGYVGSAKSTEGGAVPTADLTLRVPVDQFETLLGRTRAMGKPTSVATSGQDVTAAFVDLDARIHALQDTRTQYLQILSKATAIGDILSVEQQLSALQTQIEQLQGQQKVLADQSAFGTLSVHVSEPGSSGSVAAPPSGLAKAWAHARHSFGHGVEALIGASGGVLVFLLCAAVLLLAGRLAWPVIRRRLV